MANFPEGIEIMDKPGTVEINSLDIVKQAEIDALSKTKGIKRPNFPWNDRSYQSFKEVVGTGVPMGGKEEMYTGWGFNRIVMSNRDTVGNWINPGFMERCDLRQGPVRHILHNLTRLKEKEYDENGDRTGETKEWLTYVIRHEGKDFAGRKIASPEIVEGVYQKWNTTTEILDFSPTTGEPRIAERLGNSVIIYYIPWEGKKTIDKIFATYPGSEDSLDECVFTIKYKYAGGVERNQVTFERFRDFDLEHLEFIGLRVGDKDFRKNVTKIDASKDLYIDCPCKKCDSARATRKSSSKSSHIQ